MNSAYRIGLAGVVLSIFAGGAAAGTFTFNGVFADDQGRASFILTLNSAASITIDTTSYANGGFAPVLSIFGPPATGDPGVLGFNDGPGGGPCGIRGTNPTTGLCLDAVLDSVSGPNPLGTLSAGTYLVVLTEAANTPNGPFLSSGFSEDGQGNFTAVPGVNPGPFVDPSNPNITDSGDWGVTFKNADNVAPAGVPEPGSVMFLLGGLSILASVNRRKQIRR